MSSLIVEVTTISEIKDHSNADSLQIALIKGWNCVVKKGLFTTGDKVVYMPVDTVIPQELSDRLGVTQYLSKQRIRCARLRGEPSFGLVIKPDEDWPIGTDVAAYYSATKFDPPVKLLGEQQERDHALFVKYTDIENMRNYPDVFQEGETVVCLEKLDGTNSRSGCVQGQLMAGSHNMRRRRPEAEDNDYYSFGTYWFPLMHIQEVNQLVTDLGSCHEQVIIFGEIIGPKIQHLTYGQKGLAFRAFDIMLDGLYLDIDNFLATCLRYGVQTVPELARIPYSLDAVKELASGKAFAGGHIREGVVVKPLHERVDPKLGRVILKYKSDDYLLGLKEGQDSTDV